MTDAQADTICSVVKNEQRYLMEWISYHSLLGIKKFVIYDNESDDGTKELLLRLEKKGYVQYVSWPTPEKGSPQYSALAHFLLSQRSTSSFVAILDPDEFISMPHGFSSLDQYFDSNGLYDPSISAVALNQRVFGSSGLVLADPEYVIARFTKAAEEYYVENCWFKSFFRPSQVSGFVSAHCVQLREGRYVDVMGRDLDAAAIRSGTTPSVTDGLRVNHYILKSLEEFRTKQKRGGAAGSTAESRVQRYEDGFFFGRDVMVNKVHHSYPDAFLQDVRALERQIMTAIA